MTPRSITSCCIGSLLAIAAYAEPLPFRASIDVQEVTATGALWRVRGAVTDSSFAGFDGLSVRTNDVLSCESRLGDVDLYRITAISTQTVSWLDCLVAYDGTGTAARVGAPTFGQAALSLGLATNAIPIPQYFGPRGPSPYLRDGMAAVALQRIAAGLATAGSGPAGTGGVDTVARAAIDVLETGKVDRAHAIFGGLVDIGGNTISNAMVVRLGSAGLIQDSDGNPVLSASSTTRFISGAGLGAPTIDVTSGYVPAADVSGLGALALLSSATDTVARAGIAAAVTNEQTGVTLGFSSLALGGNSATGLALVATSLISNALVLVTGASLEQALRRKTHGVSAVMNTAQSIGSGAYTIITNYTEVLDYGAEFNPATGVFTCAQTRQYLILAGGEWQNLNATVTYIMRIYVDGSGGDFKRRRVPSTEGETYYSATCVQVQTLTAGQTVDLRAYQASGGSESFQYAFLVIVPWGSP